MGGSKRRQPETVCRLATNKLRYPRLIPEGAVVKAAERLFPQNSSDRIDAVAAMK
jgi:hypothetical protein